MSPAGRPPISDARKHERLMIRLTESEKAIFDAAAAIAGKPTSTWARDELLRLAKEATAGTPATKKAPTVKKKPAK